MEPSDCLVAEDALAGVDAAIAGGFDSAGIGEAAGHPDVTWKLGTFSDILRIQEE